ncbi:phosphate ABC transporter substrate-binding protein [Clostridium tertium]|jgi:phosphate transport system substrate-binding protein|uniref:Phosphate-binding protein n=1 Tax=Clostridium tertium TaxID=1559 RepID=A0A9X3XGW4_9CLOT|nr:phosphate ABC transporter substrate-binding protein [Clostridium tertium]MDB1939982.1 phosphate ABC transporter substrate-binding protein [Clostridium tertium]MDB1947139.1 phosphate ABC transporter substrate-binding protein [Clostridium tertium]MDB1953948.1 phosphate ABC transporter substrate-binding protein [Clostridium tertium]MDB1957051.1 phosphate ABC transporter substrate-binding protein [Clostridium tertium]MDB1963109.1 phosphate ABC transporter substrate-binding protein [Clostridium 
MKRKSLKLICTALLVTVVGGAFVGCGNDKASGESTGEKSTTISISGSTSVGPLMEKIAEKYESDNSNVSIEINQVGSSAGIKDAINGVSEIGMSSRELKTEEEKEVKPTVIAYDGIAIITNKNNQIKNITLEQIKGIYTGKITNWKEIEGGKDAPIVVASREEGSGTRDAFQEIVGYKSEELKTDAMISNGNGGLKETVIGNENAIGFVSFEYLDDKVNIVNVENVEPKADLVKSGEYKISRPFLLATKEGNLSENGQKLIDFILSDEGQTIVKENKLIPVK